jgi:crossover junction endodeoxyribonuclease RusA
MIDTDLAFVTYGTPAPKGSLKCVGRNGRHQLIEDNPKTSSWREAVAGSAERNLDDRLADYGQPIGVEVTLTIERPAGHYGTGRNSTIVKASAPAYPTALRTGDVDKLARTILDALEDAGILDNDAQVVELIARKAWTDDPATSDALYAPGAIVRLYPIGETPYE